MGRVVRTKIIFNPTQRAFSGRRSFFTHPEHNPGRPTEEPREIDPHKIECTYLNEDETIDLDKAIKEAIRDIEDPKYKGRRKAALWFNEMLNEKSCTTLQGERLLALAALHGESYAMFYSQVAFLYAEKGDVNGVLDVITRMNKAGFPTDEPTFADLAYAYFKNRKYNKVLEIFDHINEDGYRAGLGLYTMALYSSRILKDAEKETEISTKMVQDGFDIDLDAKNMQDFKETMREWQELGDITPQEEKLLVQTFEQEIPSYMFPLKPAAQNVQRPQTL